METGDNPPANLPLFGQFVNAVGYRVAENHGVAPVVGRTWVRDVIGNGPKSKYFHQVVDALWDLYKPVIQASIPLVVSVVKSTIQVTQHENQRGWDLHRKYDAGHE